MREPLSATDARRLVRKIFETGTVTFTKHAEKEMANDHLAKTDIANILRAGTVGEGEWENGSWRYQAYT